MYREVRQLLLAKRAGATFDRVLTVGRQQLFLRRRDVGALNQEFGRGTVGSDLASEGGYCDRMFRELFGVRELDAIDASGHEGAMIVHDLNVPVGSSLHQSYNVIIDGGSLEHIFNVPVALASLMRMLQVDGWLLLTNPANNLCGHGFYQFSPEFAFRVFRPANGFELERVSLVEARFPSVELSRRRPVLEVADPDQIGTRVLRLSSRVSMLMVLARKIQHLSEPFAHAPQQSDYVARWEEPSVLSQGARGFTWLPLIARQQLRGVREIFRASRFNRQAYTPSK